MSTLTASLLGLILIALAVVLAFNFLQGRQMRLRDAWRETLARGSRPSSPAPERVEPSAVADDTRAAGSERIEPSFGDGPSVRAVASPRREGTEPAFVVPGDDRHDDERDAPAVPASRPARAADADADAGAGAGAETPARAPAAASPAAARPVPHQDGPVLDPRLDCIVEFGLSAPIAPERLLTAASALRRAGSKPVAIEADAGDGRWTVPHAAGGALRRVRAGVLLANRHGPLNAMEFSEFGTAMVSFGRAIGAGGAAVPDMGPVLEHARQLDDACAQLDAVIGLNVETPTALSPDELAALASGIGLSERGNTRFAALGADGEVLYSLSLGERAEQLTLLLDVPRAPEPAGPWIRMVECAGACAERTGGRVVDDAGRVLTEAMVREVARQLGQRYRSLEEAGLDAGSPSALRVFN